MKKSMILIISSLILSSYVATAIADSPKDRGRDVIDMKMGIMDLEFHHWKHQSLAHDDCYACHKTKIGVIDGWGKDVAHKTCIPCHDLENKGPVQCHECHGK